MISSFNRIFFLLLCVSYCVHGAEFKEGNKVCIVKRNEFTFGKDEKNKKEGSINNLAISCPELIGIAIKDKVRKNNSLPQVWAWNEVENTISRVSTPKTSKITAIGCTKEDSKNILFMIGKKNSEDGVNRDIVQSFDGIYSNGIYSKGPVLTSKYPYGLWPKKKAFVQSASYYSRHAHGFFTYEAMEKLDYPVLSKEISPSSSLWVKCNDKYYVAWNLFGSAMTDKERQLYSENNAKNKRILEDAAAREALRIYDLKGNLIYSMPYGSEKKSWSRNTVALHPADKPLIAFRSPEKQVTVVDFEKKEVIATIASYNSKIKSLAWHPQEEILFVGNKNGSIGIFNNKIEKIVGGEMEAHNGDINALAISDDGQTLVSGGSDGKVCTWDIQILKNKKRKRDQFEDYE